MEAYLAGKKDIHMSHDLEFNQDGEAQAMFMEVAWHRLGTVVGANFGWLDAVAQGLAITHLVSKWPIGDLILGYEAQEDEYAAVRADGLVLKTGLGEQWTPFQAEQGYEFGQAIKERAEEEGIAADLVSLGTLDKGRKWFMTFALGDFAIGDYKITDNLSVNGSYDSSWPLQVLSSPIVEVCANTVAMAKQAGQTHYRFKHTSGIFHRVEEAKRALGRHRANRAAFQAIGEGLLRTPVTAEGYSKVLNALFPVDDTAEVKISTKARNANEEAKEKVNTLYKASPFVDSVGNGWSVVQAVNTYENWGTPIRKTKGQGEATTRAMRQIEALNGNGQPLTMAAIDAVMPEAERKSLVLAAVEAS